MKMMIKNAKAKNFFKIYRHILILICIFYIQIDLQYQPFQALCRLSSTFVDITFRSNSPANRKLTKKKRMKMKNKHIKDKEFLSWWILVC